MYDLILKNCKIVNENIIVESDIAIKNNRIELIQILLMLSPKKLLILMEDMYYLGLLMIKCTLESQA